MGWWDNTKDFAGDAWNSVRNWGKGQVDPTKAQLQDGGFMRDYIKQQLGGINGRPAPMSQAATIATQQQNAVRGQQQSLAAQLMGVASGQQMGAGEMATRRQMQQGIAAQQAQARMARGGNAALGARAAARAIGDMNTTGVGMSREAAMQDQGAARSLLAGVLGQTRDQDIGLAQAQAGLQQQTSLANQAAALQQQGMNDQAAIAYLAQMHGVSLAEMQAALAQEQTQLGQTSIWGDVLQMGGAAAAAYAGKP